MKRQKKRPNGGAVDMTAERNIISFKKSAKENLFQPVDALPLGIFRFLFGFLLSIEFLFLSRGTFPYYHIESVFHFTYPLFDLLGFKPLSKPFLWLIFNALQISTVGIMLGLLTRICFIVFTSAFGYFFHGERSLHQSLLSHFSALIFDVLWPFRLHIFSR